MEKERIKLEQERVKLQEERIRFEEERNAFRSTAPIYQTCPIFEGSNVNPGMRYQQQMQQAIMGQTDQYMGRDDEEDDFSDEEGYRYRRPYYPHYGYHPYHPYYHHYPYYPYHHGYYHHR